MSYLISAVSNYPQYKYSQQEMADYIKAVWPEEKELIEQFMNSTEVKFRYLSLPIEEYRNLKDVGRRNNVWREVALTLQKKNIEQLLQNSGIDIRDIGLISSASSTGMCVPSLEALLMNFFPFSPHTKRLPIFGLGCLAGVAGINRVNDYLKGHPDMAALYLVTELCSLTFQFHDSRVANIVGSSLFGDGCAAVLMVGKDHPLATKGKLEIIDSESVFYHNTERIMGWDMVDTGFQIVLSNDIPNLVKENVGKNIDNFLSRKDLTQESLEYFIAHPGGPKVLRAVASSLKRKEEEFSLSFKSLMEKGNTSASSVLNVLEETLKRTDLVKNSLGMMMALGPAFSLELNLVRKC